MPIQISSDLHVELAVTFLGFGVFWDFGKLLILLVELARIKLATS
jgi:hypothetical protein